MCVDTSVVGRVDVGHGQGTSGEPNPKPLWLASCIFVIGLSLSYLPNGQHPTSPD